MSMYHRCYVEWVEQIGGDVGDITQVQSFDTEREARSFFNALADGSRVICLRDDEGVIVRSAFPVLMVA